MRILAIDTSTMLGSVALCDDDELVAEEQLGVEVTHSERLVATIEHLLFASKWPKHSIDGIAVAIGPGSFTGLRIGLATAKGLAIGLNKPIVGISSLATLALNGLLSKSIIVSVIDARRGEVYAAAYEFDASTGKVKCILKECVCPPENLCDRLNSFKRDLVFVGDGIIPYKDIFRQILKERLIVPPYSYRFPRASNLAQLALERLKKGDLDNIAQLVPNYLRHSDAEIGFKGKQKSG